MAWLHICQGLMLAGFVLRSLGNIFYAVNGRKSLEATGALGVFISLVWAFFTGLVLWRSGALSTIVGSP